LKPVNWSRAGITGDEEGRLERVQVDPESFPLPRLISLWQQWVSEGEAGQCWVSEDIEAAWATRDDLEDALAIVPIDLQDRVFALVDELDLRFRDATVPSTLSGGSRPGRWWSGRIPIRNRPRFYLLNGS
jgi:hypothetical protein